jgi:hypothetical protein
MKGLLKQIQALCMEQGIYAFSFIPEDYRWAWIPEVNPRDMDLCKFRIAAAVTYTGTTTFAHDLIQQIPQEEVPVDSYETKFKNMIDKGLELIAKHPCTKKPGYCEMNWKVITREDDECFFMDRDVFIKQIRRVQKECETMLCKNTNMSSVFPSEKDLKVYTKEYYETINKITELLDENVNECLFMFGYQYFDPDAGKMITNIIYGGGGGIGGPEFSFIKDKLNIKK